jgi:hypothetical protein
VTIVGAPHVVSIDPTVGSFPVVVNNGRIGRVGVDKLTISVLLVATSGGATVNKMLGFVTTGRVGKLVIVVVAALLIVAERFDGVVGARGDNLLEIMLVDVGSTGVGVIGGGLFCSKGSCRTSMLGHGELGLLKFFWKSWYGFLVADVPPVVAGVPVTVAVVVGVGTDVVAVVLAVVTSVLGIVLASEIDPILDMIFPDDTQLLILLILLGDWT